MIKAVFTDLDKTLLKDNGTFSEANLNSMKMLKDNGIILIIATGRNILSAKKVLITEHPFEYLMFSSGAGFLNWQTKNIIYENHINKEDTKRAIEILLEYDVDFMVHDIIPENHKFRYWSHHSLPDFKRRIELYKEFAQPLKLKTSPIKSTQLLAILKQNDEKKFESIKNELSFLKVIRATSPLDNNSIWLEVFPKNISKGHSAIWLCKKLNIGLNEIVGIGNDFNDVDLLEITHQSFVVANAHKDLRQKYNVVASNEDDGFTEVVMKIKKK
ncbi:MAG: HAD-IIB family hydrolase [Candidatus Tenebribacter mawsonii]|nr:HAD-IIB family hydrolase [Candidatus Tenebribacter mawsonii]